VPGYYAQLFEVSRSLITMFNPALCVTLWALLLSPVLCTEGGGGEATCIEGDCENGWPHVPGTMQWESGLAYTGVFKDAKPHGNGIMTWKSGGKYDGQWESGEMNGKGNDTYPSGDNYVGGYLNGLMHGQGVFTWADGDTSCTHKKCILHCKTRRKMAVGMKICRKKKPGCEGGTSGLSSTQ
jgi:hypothetical protein